MSASGKRRLIRGEGFVVRISDDYEPQFPVVGEDLPWPATRDVVASQVGAVQPLETMDQQIMAVGDSFRLPCSDSDDSDDDVLSVGPVRPLKIAAPLGGARMENDCRLQVDSLNDVLSVGAWASENRHDTFCARLDDFDWVVPPYDLDMILPSRELDKESSEFDRDIRVVPEKFPVVVNKTAVEPLCLPVIVQTRPQVGCDPDLTFPVDEKDSQVEDGPDMTLPGRELGVEISEVDREICVVPDEFPVVVAKTAVEPLFLPVVVETRPQVGGDPTLTLPVDEEKISQVEDGPDMLSGRVMDMGYPDVGPNIQVLLEVVSFVVQDGCPTGWLETKFDGSMIEEIVLVPEMSPIVSMKTAVVPTFLPAFSEVCSLAVLAGGVVAATNPLAVVESVTARVSVLPDVGSELPTVSDVSNGAVDLVGLRVGQLCLRMDSEETLPALHDEQSVMSFFVRPAVVLIILFFCHTMSLLRISLVCHVDLDSLWMVHWEDRRTIETGSHTRLSVWRRVICSVDRLSRLLVFPDTACLKSFGNL